MSQSPESILRNAILGDEQFVEAVFQGARAGAANPWQRVTIRPVLLRDERHLQFVYFDGTQTFTSNYQQSEQADQLAEVLALPFKSASAATASETFRVQYSKKGRPILHRERHQQAIPLDMAHDRAKSGILDEEDLPPFLGEIGIATTDGRIRAGQQRKFRQINEFLRLIEETGEVERPDVRPLRVVDLGCGSAALTFATYHYLNAVRDIPTVMTGVDTKAHLMKRHGETAARLGWEGMRFEPGRIIDYDAAEPPAAGPPDIVLALHACDTATDEALARAVTWGSRLIFSAPCCHHHLQAQLAASETPQPFRPVARHGIMMERLGDILTDAFRAQILRLLGYQTDVIEFVAVEHTPKNLMIRAVRADAPPLAALVAEYKALKAYWGVTPYLEELLRDELAPILAD